MDITSNAPYSVLVGLFSSAPLTILVRECPKHPSCVLAELKASSSSSLKDGFLQPLGSLGCRQVELWSSSAGGMMILRSSRCRQMQDDWQGSWVKENTR